MNVIHLIPEACKIRSELFKNELHQNKLRENIAQLNKRIEEATSRGISSTCFIVTNYDVKDEIRDMYLSKGYHFKPTGMIGGVVQSTEEICW